MQIELTDTNAHRAGGLHSICNMGRATCANIGSRGASLDSKLFRELEASGLAGVLAGLRLLARPIISDAQCVLDRTDTRLDA